MPTGFSQSGFLKQFHLSMIESEAPMDASSAYDILNGVIVILKTGMAKQFVGTFVVYSGPCDRKLSDSSTPYDQFISV